MDHAAWSSVWKTGGFLAVCCRITEASGLEYIFARKCPLPCLGGRWAAALATRAVSGGSCGWELRVGGEGVQLSV
jgi:hypothetical protein